MKQKSHGPQYSPATLVLQFRNSSNYIFYPIYTNITTVFWRRLKTHIFTLFMYNVNVYQQFYAGYTFAKTEAKHFSPQLGTVCILIM